MCDKVFFISGLSDIQVFGNQSMKNTIKFLSEFGCSVHVWTFLPNDFPNLQNANEVFNSNVEFHRLPYIFSGLLRWAKKIKNSVGKLKRCKRLDPSEAAQYFGDHNFSARMFYIFFLFFFYLPIDLLRVMVYCLKNKADIFYGLNWRGAITASILGRLFRKPVLTRFQGTTLKENELRQLKFRIIHLDEILGLKAPSDAIVMTDDGTRGDRILSMLNVDEKRTYFWMNGVDVDDLILPNGWNPRQFRRTLGLEGKKVILMVSKLRLWKRVDRGIYCVHKLIKERRLDNIVLLIAGDGEQRHALEQIAEDLAITDSVKFLGGVPHKEIAKYYSIADIFLSLYDVSNLGNPLLEAMYFGLPIITIDDGTTSYLLKHGDNGFLVPTENLVEGLPSALKTLLDDDLLRERVKRRVLATAKAKILSWQDRMRLEDELIKNLLEEAKQNGRGQHK